VYTCVSEPPPLFFGGGERRIWFHSHTGRVGRIGRIEWPTTSLTLHRYLIVHFVDTGCWSLATSLFG
jgi:hypothetical protein